MTRDGGRTDMLFIYLRESRLRAGNANLRVSVMSVSLAECDIGKGSRKESPFAFTNQAIE